MKKNIKRIISFTLMLSLLVGMMAGFSVFAAEENAETPKVEIVSKNVYYDDTLKLMYAVATDDENVKVNIYNANDELVETITEYNNEDVDGDEVEEKTFTSKYGVPAQDIDTVWYAEAVLSDGTKTDKVRYSVLEYLYERLTTTGDKAPTEAQATMYNNLLAFADSADIVVNKDTAENSIANYAYVTVTNGTLDGTYSSGMLMAGTALDELTTDYTVGSGMSLAWDIETSVFGNNASTSTQSVDAIAEFTVEAGKCYKLTATEMTAGLETKSYAYTFESKVYVALGTQTLGGVNWTVSGEGQGYFGYEATRGQQFGSGTNPYSSLTMVSDSFSNVSKIVINTAGASSIVGTLKVYVGDTLVETITLEKTATEYTIAVNDISGPVKLEYTQTSSKALYIKYIAVDYAE